MKTGLPTGLSGLLAKLGIGVQKPGETQVSEKALHGGEAKDAKHAEKGKELGDGTLLSGIGYNSEDRHAAMKNVAEKANIDRFMQDVSGDVKEMQQALRDMNKDGDAAPAGDKREAANAKESDGPAPKELREEAQKKEEKADDVRAQAQETKEQQRDKESAEAKEREREREREREKNRDDEDKHGQGWVQEELAEEEEAKRGHGLREADALGEAHRCRAELGDGTRCIRKPVSGTPYCRAHAIQH